MAAAVLSSCSKAEETGVQTAENAERYCMNEQLKKSTAVADVHYTPITEQILLPGKVDYNENDLVTFRSLLEGTVSSVNFELGDHVRAGQVLATINSTQIQELYQQQRSFQNEIASIRKQIESKRELLKDGMIAAPELRESEHQLANARIELDRVQQILRMYRANGQGSFQIVAPKSGYIIQKNISPGQSISADEDALFAISNLDQVWVMVNIYASTLRHIKVGDPVRVKTVADPDRLYYGKIDKIYNVFDDDEHVLKARVVLENQNMQLMPGLAADIIIDKSSSQGNAYAVPNSAKVFHNNKEYVVVYKDDCNLTTRRITPIASNEEVTYVKEDFGPGEKVISKNALLLFEQLNP